MINQGILIKNGYSKYIDSILIHSHKNIYLESYQKRIIDEHDTKYFINIDFFDMKTFNSNLDIQFQSNVQFNLKNGFTFNVDGLNNKNITIEELENFYEKIWQNMDCKYCE